MRLDTVLAWQLAANDKNTGKKYILFGKGAWFDNHWFQLLETLPQRLRNGVCLFNGVTMIF
jgi:hypothetical protein